MATIKNMSPDEAAQVAQERQKWEPLMREVAQGQPKEVECESEAEAARVQAAVSYWNDKGLAVRVAKRGLKLILTNGVALLVLGMLATGCCSACKQTVGPNEVYFLNEASVERADKPGYWLVSDGWLAAQYNERKAVQADNEELLGALEACQGRE